MKNPLRKRLLYVFFAGFLILASCSGEESGSTDEGGTEVGNPPSNIRLIKGQISSLSNINQCIATKVKFVDSSGQSSSISVGSDCTFSTNLNEGDAKTMTFFEEETLLAIMTFNHHREMFESNILIVSHGVEPIDFGQIQFTGTKGRAALEPAYQNDQDGDGIVDFDDEDDDNDGTPDVDERDCDFDGFFYANDLDNSSCEAAGDIGDVPLQPGEDWILEVLPRNQAKFVSIDQPVKVRANCVVDPTSLSRAYFSVGDSKGGHITCNLSLSSSGREVICNHDNFLANMYHTATVEGLDCADHDGGIRSVTWHFTTAVPSD